MQSQLQLQKQANVHHEFHENVAHHSPQWNLRGAVAAFDALHGEPEGWMAG